MATDITLRATKGSSLTHADMDQNFESLSGTVDAKTLDYAVLVTDQNKILEFNGSSLTATLPAVALADGVDTGSWRVTFRNINSTALIIAANGAETIDGLTSISIGQYSSMTIGLDAAKTGWGRVNSVGDIPVGSLMLFQQTSAPTGWTKQVAHNDKALRVVSGIASSGGTDLFSSTFSSSKATDSHTLLTTEIPSHTHGAGTLSVDSAGGHTHGTSVSANSTSESIGSYPDGIDVSTKVAGGYDTDSAGAHTHTISGTSGASGSGGGHTHTIAMDVQYVDIIIASKD